MQLDEETIDTEKNRLQSYFTIEFIDKSIEGTPLGKIEWAKIEELVRFGVVVVINGENYGLPISFKASELGITALDFLLSEEYNPIGKKVTKSEILFPKFFNVKHL